MEQIVQDEEDAIWVTRNEHWLSEQDQRKGFTPKRNAKREPLILCGHGVSLNIDKGSLLIKDGFTHYPQVRKQYRYFRGDIRLPSRIIMLDGKGSLSFDVIDWLADMHIPLVRLDYQGKAVSVIGGTGYASDLEKVQWQVETRNDPEKRLEFCRQLITRKLQASHKTLRDIIPDSKARSVAMVATEAAVNRLENNQCKSIEDIRMLEANSAARYFSAWRGLALNWQSKWKYPIPEDWLTIAPRNSISKGGYISNRNAKHPVNAILNYAYGLLYAETHIESVVYGFDPRRGIMHHDRAESDAFPWVFDMIEPRRPEVDAKVLKFLFNTPLMGADFVTTKDGVCRLGPQLARFLANYSFPR